MSTRQLGIIGGSPDPSLPGMSFTSAQRSAVCRILTLSYHDSPGPARFDHPTRAALDGTGVLIHPRVVLTAGHVTGTSIDTWETAVLFGTGGFRIPFSPPETPEIHIHRITNGVCLGTGRAGPVAEAREILDFAHDDLSLLLLSEDAPAWVSPIGLRSAPSVGDLVQVAGYGPTRSELLGSESAPLGWSIVTVSHVPSSGCSFLTRDLGAEIGGRQTRGDSGGPAFAPKSGGIPGVCGIISTVSDVVVPGRFQSVYTRTDHWLSWITRTMSGWGLSFEPASLPGSDATGDRRDREPPTSAVPYVVGGIAVAAGLVWLLTRGR